MTVVYFGMEQYVCTNDCVHILYIVYMYRQTTYGGIYHIILIFHSSSISVRQPLSHIG